MSDALPRSSLDDLRVGTASRTTSLFASELLCHPGFVEFDDVNQKVLTFCSEERTYKVWSMAEPSRVLYQLCDPCIDEVKISPGIMLLVLQKTQSHVPLKVCTTIAGHNKHAHTRYEF